MMTRLFASIIRLVQNAVLRAKTGPATISQTIPTATDIASRVGIMNSQEKIVKDLVGARLSLLMKQERLIWEDRPRKIWTPSNPMLLWIPDWPTLTYLVTSTGLILFRQFDLFQSVLCGSLGIKSIQKVRSKQLITGLELTILFRRHTFGWWSRRISIGSGLTLISNYTGSIYGPQVGEEWSSRKANWMPCRSHPFSKIDGRWSRFLMASNRPSPAYGKTLIGLRHSEKSYSPSTTTPPARRPRSSVPFFCQRVKPGL